MERKWSTEKKWHKNCVWVDVFAALLGIQVFRWAVLRGMSMYYQHCHTAQLRQWREVGRTVENEKEEDKNNSGVCLIDPKQEILVQSFKSLLRRIGKTMEKRRVWCWRLFGAVPTSHPLEIFWSTLFEIIEETVFRHQLIWNSSISSSFLFFLFFTIIDALKHTCTFARLYAFCMPLTHASTQLSLLLFLFQPLIQTNLVFKRKKRSEKSTCKQTHTRAHMRKWVKF